MIWYVGALCFAMILVGSATWGYLAYTLKADKEKTLRSRADRLVDSLQRSPSQLSSVSQEQLDAMLSGMPEGGAVRLILLNEHGALLASRCETASAMPDRVLPAGFAWMTLAKVRFKTLTLEKQIAGQRVLLEVASQYEDNFHFLNDVAIGLSIICPVAIALSVFGGYVLSGQALQPIRDLAAGAATVSITDLSRRLPVPRTGDELQTIAESFDALLVRLQEALRRQTRFTADASHDLRTPLTIVRTTVEVALRSKGDQGLRQALDDVLVECGEMEKILDDLLLLARLEGDGQAIPAKTIPLLPLLTEIADRMEAKAAERQVNFLRSFKMATDEAVRIDREAFTRCIGALLDNAIQYTEPGGRVTIQAFANANAVMCIVRDTGIGIPAEALPHIFERFFRGDRARTMYSNGTGLGLAIAKWTVETHHGRIEAQSEEGKGTEIRIVLPSARAEHPAS